MTISSSSVLTRRALIIGIQADVGFREVMDGSSAPGRLDRNETILSLTVTAIEQPS